MGLRLARSRLGVTEGLTGLGEGLRVEVQVSGLISAGKAPL